MLRWAVLAITHVFSQAKPPVAPSQAQTMVESIPSSTKVSNPKLCPEKEKMARTKKVNSPSKKLWCDGLLGACTKCTAGWQQSEEKFILHRVQQWKWYSIENLKKTHLKKEYDDQENPVSSEEYARFFKGTTVAEDRDDQDESANCNQDVCCLLYHCRLHKVLDWAVKKINTRWYRSLTFKICFASSSRAWLTGLFECAVRLRVRLE